MKHFLTVIIPDQKAIKYALKGKTITVGRASTNAITLDVPEVSSKHLEFRASDTGYVAVDLESTNGTTINQAKLAEYQLADGDELIIGLHVRAKYTAVADEAAQATPAAPLQPQVVEAGAKPSAPTVVLKRAPVPGAAAAQPAQPQQPAQPVAPPGVVVRKMQPPGAEEPEAPLPIAQPVAEEPSQPAAPADEEPEAAAEPETRPKLSIPKPAQGGPKKLNLG